MFSACRVGAAGWSGVAVVFGCVDEFVFVVGAFVWALVAFVAVAAPGGCGDLG